jgi:hypothetical protein
MIKGNDMGHPKSGDREVFTTTNEVMDKAEREENL